MSGTVKRDYVRPLDIKNGRVDMSHGSGGRASAQLIEQLFAAAFANEWLAQKNDQATLPRPAGRIRRVKRVPGANRQRCRLDAAQGRQ